LITHDPVTAALSGTIDGVTESAVRAGGETIILTLTNDTWHSDMGTLAGTTITNALLAGITGDQNWDLITLDYTDVEVDGTGYELTITIPEAKAADYYISTLETVGITIPDGSFANTIGDPDVIPDPASFQILNVDASLAVTGTIISDSPTEVDIRDGGKTMILTLTDERWHDDIETDAKADILFNNITGGTGWAAVKTELLISGTITKNTNWQITITLPAVSGYDIFATEEISISAVVDVLKFPQASTITLSPAFSVLSIAPSVAVTGTIVGGADGEGDITSGLSTIILTLTEGIWESTLGDALNTPTQALISSITGDGDWASVTTALEADYTKISRDDDYIVTITIPSTAYNIYADETVTIDVHADAVQYTSTNVLPISTLTILHDPLTVEIGGTFIGANESAVRAGNKDITLTMTNDIWHADMGNDDPVTDELIAGITGDGSWGTVNIDHTNVVRTDDIVTITIPLEDATEYYIGADEKVSIAEIPVSFSVNTAYAVTPAPSSFQIIDDPVTVDVTGTMTAATGEGDIIDGGRTIILDLTGDRWLDDIHTSLASADFLYTSISGTEWDLEVYPDLGLDEISRDNDTVVTITLPESPYYNIYADETVTINIDPDALKFTPTDITVGSSLTITHDPITASIGGTILTSRTESDLRENSYYLSITVENDELSLSVGADNDTTTAILDNLTGDQNWSVIRGLLDFNNVERTNNNTLIITVPAVPDYFLEADETVTAILPASALEHGTYDLDPGTTFTITDELVTLAVSGTMTTIPNDTEEDIRDGGRTIILTLTGDEWVDDIETDTKADLLFSGITGGTGLTEWAAVKTELISTGAITQNSATEVEITLPAVSSYNINVQEDITVTVPNTVLKHSTIVADVSTGSTDFSVYPLAASVSVAGTIVSGDNNEGDIISGASTIELQLTEGLWETTLGADNAFTDSLLTSFAGNGDWATVTSALTFADIDLVGQTVTITIPTSVYNIYVDETVNINVDALAVQSTSTDIATSSLTIQHDSITAVLGGTIVDATESAVRTSDHTITLTLTNDTWHADMGTATGTKTDDLLAGISASIWDSKLTGLDESNVSFSTNVLMVTIPAAKAADYYIGANDTVGVTIPDGSFANTSGYAVTPAPTGFPITNEIPVITLGGTIFDATENKEDSISSGGPTIILTLSGDEWETDIGIGDNTITSELINSFAGNGDWETVTSVLTSGDINLAGQTVTITLPSSAYNIYIDETVTITVDAATLQTTTVDVGASSTLTIVHDPVTAVLGGTILGANESTVRTSDHTITLTLTNDVWDPTMGAANSITTNLLNGISAANWDSKITSLDDSNVSFTDNVLTVTIPAEKAAEYYIGADETVGVTIPDGSFANTIGYDVTPVDPSFQINNDSTSIEVTGTIFDSTEDGEGDIRSGSVFPTIILTLTGDTWISGIADANASLIINSITSATEWDAEVRANLTSADITQGSDTVVTITLPELSTYDIYNDETLAINVAADALQTTTVDVGASSTLTIAHDTVTAVLGGSILGANESDVRGGGKTITLTLTNDVWHANMGTDVTLTNALLDGITGSGSWDQISPNLTIADVGRTDNIVTITIPLADATDYYIGANETVGVTIPDGSFANTSGYEVTPVDTSFQINNESTSIKVTGTIFDGTEDGEGDIRSGS
ncbi:MAG: hypothetical protein KAS71_09470, partial [Bacteroidales bacterium]|nr:hypothetical protein [Bacteroidales bacterium]